MHWTEVIRAALGLVAFIVAGAQITMRWMIAHEFPKIRRCAKAKERSMSLALLLLLTGIGVGNLTHLNHELTISTGLITAGVVVAAVGLVDVARWGKEESDINARVQQPTKDR